MFHCVCVPDGQPSPHSSDAECRANQQSTRSYMRGVSAAVGLGPERPAPTAAENEAAQADYRARQAAVGEGYIKFLRGIGMTPEKIARIVAGE